MRIHTDKINTPDLWYAESGLSGIHVEHTEHGSRKRDHAFNVALSAEPRKGRRPRNSGNRGAYTLDAAATWDEWGVFIANLFAADPNAIIGQYDGLDDFRHQTGNRYDVDNFTPCDQHRWAWNDDTTDWKRTCSKGCGAVQRLPLKKADAK